MRAAAILVFVLAVTGCAVAVETTIAPPSAPPTTVVAAPLPEIFDLAALVAERSGGLLADASRAEINGALAALIGQGREGTRIVWSGSDGRNEGTLRLSRFGALIGDVRTCALVQHEHRLDLGAVRGSIRLCKRGDGDWRLDDVVWRRTGGDLAGIGDGRRTS
ncbi:MAG: hypothetical protein RID42_16110 [Alphaproteobacteria bacterium]